MKIDAGIVTQLSKELNDELAGCRIEKIQQPAKDIILITVNKKKLLISTKSAYSRIHITDNTYEFPPEAPMFCMLLRKHIGGSLIENIQQLNCDRIIEINLRNFDNIGRQLNEKLIIEMIPQSANIILTDSSYMIIDCIRRKDFDRNMYRRVYPGNIYKIPLKTNAYSSETEVFPNISKTLDDYFSDLEKKDIIVQKSKNLRTSINSSIKRISKKIGIQKVELQNTYKRDEIKNQADLIVSNIYRIKKGDNFLICNDFYHDNEQVEIKLNPLKSPQENANILYKEYNKLKKAEKYLTELIENGQNQLDFLLSCLTMLNNAENESDINYIQSELIKTGFIKNRKNNSEKKIKLKPQLPLKYGELIYIGRNNTQNDELTFKFAHKDYYWFHAKDYHGSHVILATNSPTDDEINEACIQAALHSDAKGKCPVDYCQVRYVKKPSGSLPGKVIYTNFKTRLV